MILDVPGRAFGDDAAAVFAGAGAHVHHMVGRFDGLLVVLHHDHRVAEVAQFRQRLQQPRVVALVQADGGLVQHVHDAGETGADLRGQTDALCLAAGQGLGRAVQGQIVEADIDEEGDAGDDLVHDLFRHLLPVAGQFQVGEEAARLRQRPAAHLGQGAFADGDVARLAPQPRAAAFGAGAGGEVLGQFLAHDDRVGLLVAAFQAGNDALEHMLADHRAAAVGQVAEGDLLLARTLQHDFPHRLGQGFERLLDVEAVVAGQTGEHLEVELVAPVPAADAARRQRQMRVGDHPRRVEEADRAEAVAARAGAHRIVEGKEARLQFGQREAAHRAGELGGEQMFPAVIHLHRDGAAVGVGEGGFEGLGQPLARVGTHLEPVHHDVHAVLGVLGELGQVVDVVDHAVHPQPHETLRPQLDEEVGLLAFAPADHRRQDHQLGVFGQGEHRVHHLRHGARLQRQSVLRTVRRAGAGIEQAQIVVDLGDGADGGARVVAGGLLFDGDGRRQAFDQIDIGLFHQLQELARIGREGFDVAPLALRIERVEGERGLAGARQPGDHRQLVARQIEADVLQVVGAGTADADLVHGRLAGGEAG